MNPSDAGRVVVVAVGTSGARGVGDFVNEAAERGYRVDLITDDLITDDGAGPGGYHGRVRVHAIGPAERRTVLLRLTNALRARVFRLMYNVVRPLVLWRITRRRVVPELGRTPVDRVVVNGTAGVTIGWRLARRHPGVPATTSLSMSFAAGPAPVGAVPASADPVRSP